MCIISACICRGLSLFLSLSLSLAATLYYMNYIRRHTHPSAVLSWQRRPLALCCVGWAVVVVIVDAELCAATTRRLSARQKGSITGFEMHITYARARMAAARQRTSGHYIPLARLRRNCARDAVAAEFGIFFFVLLCVLSCIYRATCAARRRRPYRHHQQVMMDARARARTAMANLERLARRRRSPNRKM